jgi:DNA-binding NtrC family response regulator
MVLKRTVLIVEDKKSMADMLGLSFSSEGFSVRTASTVREGLEIIADGSLDAVLTDLKLPDGSGMEVLRAAREGLPFAPVVVMTAYGSIETAVKAVKDGAYDFITKPFDPEHLLLLIKRALDESGLQRENLLMRKEFPQFRAMPHLVGVSAPWRDVMEKVKRVAPLKTTVLILGESGTGKELIARSIHHLSPRGGEAFVAMNCAAISRELIENELFGHEKGAYTGAHEIKPGRFELGDKGTIFLDEIGDMAMSLQSKLLRVLQESEFERVGGTRPIRVDLRVIAASNKDLSREVAEGRFREDLFYRLNVFPIVIPPLRERKDDILPLARHFIALFSREMCRAEPGITPEAEALLLRHDWKGNVRELRNVIERAVILCDGPGLRPEHFSLGSVEAQVVPDAPLHEVAESAVRRAEKVRIESALQQTAGNKSRAAEILQVSYKTLLTKIKDYGIG